MVSRPFRTDSGQALGSGAPSARMCRERSASWLARTSTQIALRQFMCEPISSRGVGDSWSSGSEYCARQTSRVTVGRSSRNIRKLCSAVRSAAGSARSLQCDQHDTELRHALRHATLATSRTGLSQNVSGMLRGLLALAPAPRLCAGCHGSARRRSGSRGPILGSCDIRLWRRPSRPLGGLDRC